jgi:hypothetical protein
MVPHIVVSEPIFDLLSDLADYTLPGECVMSDHDHDADPDGCMPAEGFPNGDLEALRAFVLSARAIMHVGQ